MWFSATMKKEFFCTIMLLLNERGINGSEGVKYLHEPDLKEKD
jgi:hypothetical protein